MHIQLDSVLRFPMNCPYRQYVVQDLTIDNPKHKSAKAFSPRSAMDIPEKLYYFNDDYANLTTTVPIGKKDLLFSCCAVCPNKCPIYDNRTIGQNITYSELVENIIPRPSQVKALDAIQNTISQSGCGLVVMPTGSGKSLLSFLTSFMSKKPTLFITHTVDLAEQAYYDYKERFGITPGFIGDGKFDINPQFTVAIIDTIYARKVYVELSNIFGLAIFDEVHMMAPESCVEVANSLSIKYKIGLTATLNRGDGLTPVIMSCFGGVVYQVTIEEVQKEGSLIPLQAFTLPTNYISPYEPEKLQKKKALINAAIKEASLDMDRNRIIANHTIELCQYGHSTLLVLQSIDQCLIVLDLLQNQPNVRPELFVGQVGKKKLKRQERKAIIDRAKTGETNVLISVQLAGVGLDVPRLTCLVMDRKITDASSVTQIVGRVVRTCPEINKQWAYVFDVEDVNVPIFKNQTQKRFYSYHQFRKYN